MRTGIYILVAAMVLLSTVTGIAAEENSTFERAIAPMRDGVPEVAVPRLRAALTKASSDEEWTKIALALAEALLTADDAGGALKLLDEPRLKTAPAAKFWKAQAFARAQRWETALPLYQELADSNGGAFAKEARFGAAECLRALGRTEEALRLLAPLLHDHDWEVRARLRTADLLLQRSDWPNAQRVLEDLQADSIAERREARFLRARVDMMQGRPERALATFESLVKKPEGASHALILSALFGVADAHLKLKTPESGDDFLEDFIDRHPHDPDLSRIFAKLDELYRAERKPARVELEKWTRETEQPRRALAQWYLSRIELRANHRDRALALLGELRKSGGKIREATPALLELARLQAENERFDDALVILEEARALKPDPDLAERINLFAGEIHYAARQFQPAALRFEEVANARSSYSDLARFNASLGWLQFGDQPRFLAVANELNATKGETGNRAELALEQGLVQAAKGDQNAAQTLQKFLRDFPESARASEAWVALAELAYHANPPRIDEARKNLAKAKQANPTPAAIERADYLSIWIEESSTGGETGSIERIKQFLAAHADSTFAGDVRMKLAEAYYRRQDFANAQTQFESIAQQNPTGPVAEKALFFAAESAMSTMGVHALDRAIELFDRVVQLKGDLRWPARNEQAVIERKLGRPQEALVLYDEVLKSDARPVDKREALCGRGDIYFEMGTQDSKNYDKAIEAYDQLAADANEPGHWHNQALFKKGVCLEKKANREAALTTFFDVVENSPRPDRPPEFFWFYKAGFNAARLLEETSKWESAAAVYEKLAAVGGTRSEEAQARLNRLRLEHFLWQK